MFQRLNRWYDNLHEPWRFGLVIVLTVTWSCGLACYRYPGVWFVALILRLFQSIWALTRL